MSRPRHRPPAGALRGPSRPRRSTGIRRRRARSLRSSSSGRVLPPGSGRPRPLRRAGSPPSERTRASRAPVACPGRAPTTAPAPRLAHPARLHASPASRRGRCRQRPPCALPRGRAASGRRDRSRRSTPPGVPGRVASHRCRRFPADRCAASDGRARPVAGPTRGGSGRSTCPPSRTAGTAAPPCPADLRSRRGRARRRGRGRPVDRAAWAS